MKAITVLQPWASLIACGAKKLETQSWLMNYSASPAIHANKILPIMNLFTPKVKEVLYN